MLFSQLSIYLQELESQASRLDMTESLACLFKELEPREVKKTCYLLQGTLVPPYESQEFQLSTKMVIRALARFLPEENEASTLFDSTDELASVAQVDKMYKKTGDLGELAYQLLSAYKTTGKKSELTILETYDLLVQVAFESGAGSQLRKLEKLQELLSQSSALAAKFIIRIIIGKLRLGFSTMTMIDGLSWAVTGGKTHRTLLEDAYQKRADIGSLAEFYLSNVSQTEDLVNAKKLLETEYSVLTGIPIVPALCQRLNSATEIIEKMKHVYVEPKYDGLRVQIHYTRKLGNLENQGNDGKENTSVTQSARAQVKVFTRNLEEVTPMFPEVQTIGENLECDEAIFDGEAIGFDPATGNLLPFQQTMNRKRKHDIAEAAQRIPLRFYLYDILKCNESELLATPLFERKKILEKNLKKNNTFITTPYIVTESAGDVKEFHERQLAEGLEGAVIKQHDAFYQSGRKGWSWVKIKESEGTSGKLSDTVDAVIMGYYLGRGSRTQFGLGAILVGVTKHSDDSDQYLTISKVGTGMSEAQLSELKNLLKEYEQTEKPKEYQVHKNLTPDIWVSPDVVVEIAADEITNSPIHTAGVALRFPRLIKIRNDKKAKDATAHEELKSIKIA